MNNSAGIDSDYFPPFANYATNSSNVNIGKSKLPPE